MSHPQKSPYDVLVDRKFELQTLQRRLAIAEISHQAIMLDIMRKQIEVDDAEIAYELTAIDAGA